MHVICNRQGQRYTDSGFKSMWDRLRVAWHKAGAHAFITTICARRSVGKLKADGCQAKDITGHTTTEATAERIFCGAAIAASYSVRKFLAIRGYATPTPRDFS